MKSLTTAILAAALALGATAMAPTASADCNPDMIHVDHCVDDARQWLRDQSVPNPDPGNWRDIVDGFCDGFGQWDECRQWDHIQ